MEVWIMIIFLSGWSAGVGSHGNAVTGIEFNSLQTCQKAISEVRSAGAKMFIFCVKK